MQAVMDTGAVDTVISATVFENTFHIVPGSTEAPQIDQSSKDPLLKSFSYGFKNLAFEGLTVANPKITVLTDRIAAGVTTNHLRSALSDPYGRFLNVLIIGMNVLKKLHIYVAYGEKKLYITPAGTGESVLFKTAEPAK